MHDRKRFGMILLAAALGLLTTSVACQPVASESSSPATAPSVSDSSTPAANAAPAAAPKPAETPAVPEPAPQSASAPASPPSSAAPPTAVVVAEVPRGLPPLPVPDDNALSPEKIELGRMLYFDRRLSRDGTIACATCHDPKMAWAEHSSTSTGIGKQVGNRNSPTILNAAYAKTQFWDGRATSLEEQALGPIENPIEMGHALPELIEQLKQIPEYRDRFQKVFGQEITKENLAQAIAAFERTILSGNAPFDRFMAGDASALSDAQKRGWEKFQASCAACHEPPLFSKYEFYNAGVGMNQPEPDPGRQKISGREHDLGKFRVPSLRNVAQTAPYFHDGSAATLEEAVALMAHGGRENAKISSLLKMVRDDHLTPEDQKDLVAFLQSLSGEIPVVEAPPLP